MNNSRGFTLIELLVVMAIIGLLASVVLASLNGARKKSRDARRIADVKQLQAAVELYISDNKVSPTTAAGLAALAPNSIPAVPSDPSGGTKAYGYAQIGSSGYVIGAILEAGGQISPLNLDYDVAQAITINAGATDCNANAGLAGEVVYCVANP